MTKEKEIIEKEPEERFALQLLKYKIYVNRRQYSVFDATEEKIDEKGKKYSGKLIGYHRTLADAIDSIRTVELRFSTLNSKSLEVAINQMISFDKAFALLLKPLKKLEDY